MATLHDARRKQIKPVTTDVASKNKHISNDAIWAWRQHYPPASIAPLTASPPHRHWHLQNCGCRSASFTARTHLRKRVPKAAHWFCARLRTLRVMAA